MRPACGSHRHVSATVADFGDAAMGEATEVSTVDTNVWARERSSLARQDTGLCCTGPVLHVRFCVARRMTASILEERESFSGITEPRAARIQVHINGRVFQHMYWLPT